MRRAYAWGYKTRTAAEIALEDMFADAEISACERPEISSYKNRDNQIRYQVTLDQ